MGLIHPPRLCADKSAKLLWTRTSWFLTGSCFLRTSSLRLCIPVLGFMFHYSPDSPTMAKQSTTCVHCICSFSSRLLCPLHIRRGHRALGTLAVHVGTPPGEAEVAGWIPLCPRNRALVICRWLEVSPRGTQLQVWSRWNSATTSQWWTKDSGV